jgi:hypothetical protein
MKPHLHDVVPLALAAFARLMWNLLGVAAAPCRMPNLGSADIIFIPYTYLTHSLTRTPHLCPLQDACNSNASFDLTTDQLLSAISETERAQEVVRVCSRLPYAQDPQHFT